MYVFFDVETTGLAEFERPLNDPSQPHIVQLALVLTDADGREIMGYKAPILLPEGVRVDEKGKAYEVNKWSNALLDQYGVPMVQALSAFKAYQSKSVLKIAHNYRFDGFLLKAAAERYGFAELSPPIEKYCTMTGIKAVTGKGSLKDAYAHVTGGKTIENAHDAMADVRACKEVFFWLKKEGHFKPQPRKVPTPETAAA